jgi:hypothetical protein
MTPFRATSLSLKAPYSSAGSECPVLFVGRATSSRERWRMVCSRASTGCPRWPLRQAIRTTPTSFRKTTRRMYYVRPPSPQKWRDDWRRNANSTLGVPAGRLLILNVSDPWSAKGGRSDSPVRLGPGTLYFDASRQLKTASQRAIRPPRMIQNSSPRPNIFFPVSASTHSEVHVPPMTLPFTVASLDSCGKRSL